MLLALLPIIQALIGGAGISTVLAGVTASQWITIGAAALKAAPAEIQIVRGLHGLLDHVIGAVLSSGSALIASEAASAWLAANGAKAIELQSQRDTDA